MAASAAHRSRSAYVQYALAGPLDIPIASALAINNGATFPLRMLRLDPDGVTEADRFGNCPDCGQWFDMRDLGQVLEHVHDQEIEIGEGPAPLRKETHWGRRKLARDQ